MYMMVYRVHIFFYKKPRSGPSTESFLASGDLEYSKFLNSVLTIFLTLSNLGLSIPLSNLGGGGRAESAWAQ